MNDDFELVRGSGNIYRDLGRPDAEIRQAKGIMAAEIVKALAERQWSTRRAEQEIGVNHADLVRIGGAKLDGFSLERLATILQAFGKVVEFTVQVRRDSNTLKKPRRVAAPT